MNFSLASDNYNLMTDRIPNKWDLIVFNFGYFYVVIHSICWYIIVCFIEKVFTPPMKKGEDPFRTDNLPENLGYQLKMKDGIVYVYPNEEAASKDEPKPLPYPNLDRFLDDMNFLLALIAQGPV